MTTNPHHSAIKTIGIAHACDTHVHIFDPENHAYDPARSYTPGEACCDQLDKLMTELGTSRCVIVQPSVYGSDNRCLVAALEHFGPERARGVGVIDHNTTTDEELRNLWKAGIRAIRVNFEAAASKAHEDKLTVIEKTAIRAKSTGMAVQLYADMDTAITAIDRLEGLGVGLILDHFAGFKCGTDLNAEAFKKLLEALRKGSVWVKLSAPYRTGSKLADYADLRDAAKAMINAAPDQMVWASDWPHTGGGADRLNRNPHDIEPFREIADQADLNRLRDWIGNDSQFANILADNPARIFDFPNK